MLVIGQLNTYSLQDYLLLLVNTALIPLLSLSIQSANVLPKIS